MLLRIVLYYSLSVSQYERCAARLAALYVGVSQLRPAALCTTVACCTPCDMGSWSTAASRTVLHYSLAKCLTLRLAALYVTLDMLISSHLMYLAALSAQVRPLRPTALTSPATCHITPLPRMYSLGFKQAPSLLCVPLPSALKSDHYG